MRKLLKLSQKNLLAINKKGIKIPNYDPTSIRPAIAHIGPGNFFRGHQAFLTDHLLNNNHKKWGILGVGIMPEDINIIKAFEDQDYLYTLFTKKHNDYDEVRIIASICDFIYAPENRIYAIYRLCDPDIKIISFNLTEKG